MPTIHIISTHTLPLRLTWIKRNSGAGHGEGLTQVNRRKRPSAIICAMHQALQGTRVNGDGRTRDPRVLEGVLSNIALFRGVAPRQVAELAARSKALHVRRAAHVSEKGEYPAGLHAIAYGQVKLALRAADGDERVLRLAGAGECFGLAVALLNRPQPFEAVALEDTLLLVVPTAAIRVLIDNDPKFMHTVLNAVAERALILLAEVESGSLHRGVQRLATYLDSLAEGAGGNGRCQVQLPTSKTVVASRLGVKKETLSRMLRDLSERGVISVEQRDIQILDRPRLSAIAREAA